MQRTAQAPGSFNITTLLLDRHLDARQGNRIALRTETEDITYRDLTERVDRCAQGLTSLGVLVEQRVLIHLPDGAEWAILFLAAMRIGAVPVAFDPFAAPEAVRWALLDSRARILITRGTTYPGIASWKHECPALDYTVAVGDGPPDCVPFDALLATRPVWRGPEATHPDDVAYWQYPAGTTGGPAAVMRLHRDLTHGVGVYARHVLAATPDDVVLSLPRLHSAAGLGSSLLLPLSCGASGLLLPSQPEPRCVSEVVRRRRPTLLFAAPACWAGILEPARDGPVDLAPVRLGVSPEGLLPPSLSGHCRRRMGTQILEGLVSPEVGYVFISNRPDAIRPGSLGQPLPGYEARIVDEAGREAGTGQAGHLLVRGKGMAAGYWNQHQRTRAVFQGEWVRTGDVVRRDGDGYVHWVGRSDPASA